MLTINALAYSVGQAGQPLLSMNYGAKNLSRIRETLKCMTIAGAIFGILWTMLICLFPNGFIRIFMNATKDVLGIAPMIMRTYGISFLFLPFNVFSTYYFQSVMQPKISLFIAFSRGIVISGLLIYLLPSIFGADAIWLSMPVTELVILILVIEKVRKIDVRFKNEEGRVKGKNGTYKKV